MLKSVEELGVPPSYEEFRGGFSPRIHIHDNLSKQYARYAYDVHIDEQSLAQAAYAINPYGFNHRNMDLSITIGAPKPKNFKNMELLGRYKSRDNAIHIYHQEGIDELLDTYDTRSVSAAHSRIIQETLVHELQHAADSQNGQTDKMNMFRLSTQLMGKTIGVYVLSVGGISMSLNNDAVPSELSFNQPYVNIPVGIAAWALSYNYGKKESLKMYFSKKSEIRAFTGEQMSRDLSQVVNISPNNKLNILRTLLKNQNIAELYKHKPNNINGSRR